MQLRIILYPEELLGLLSENLPPPTSVLSSFPEKIKTKSRKVSNNKVQDAWKKTIGNAAIQDNMTKATSKCKHVRRLS